MMKKLLFLLLVFMATLPAWAETPEECYKKHGDMLCVFVNPNPVMSEISGLNIERIAINDTMTKIYIKTIQKEDDIIRPIEDVKRGDNNGIYMMFKLSDGAFVVLDDDLNVFYLDKANKGAKFEFNGDYTFKYRHMMNK